MLERDVVGDVRQPLEGHGSILRMAESRPFEHESDLRLMADLCAETWRRLGPYAPIHVGDVAWWMYQRPNRLAEARIQLWLEDGPALPSRGTG